eukprot:CAMPEP_0174870328 /NCGR_PEP_ID=MMETSP1114-20130205/69533_1 /TAXON_ID=312471 /ORGANISM="Neobodo designis, Strain CCAP 1951/1" /LENGTH=61 /DNA_ID=CAMNT_0016105599 /DNA_START=109 /DNA_END=290 /DNA_ORIENTATION=+
MWRTPPPEHPPTAEAHPTAPHGTWGVEGSFPHPSRWSTSAEDAGGVDGGRPRGDFRAPQPT